MKRSKLEMNIAILKALAQNYSLTIKQIQKRTKISSDILKGNLCFLLKLALIEEKTIQKGNTVYANTSKAIKVLEFFDEAKIVEPNKLSKLSI